MNASDPATRIIQVCVGETAPELDAETGDADRTRGSHAGGDHPAVR